jgi:hypothetical protein
MVCQCSANLRAFNLCFVSAALLVAGGCGEKTLDRIRISGTVTYEGKPVEFGAIFFEPTESVGKIAPTVYLPVRGGKYDSEDNGPIKGKYRVTVGGMDKSKETKDDDGITNTPQLFPDYKFEVEIPPPDNKLDVEVPVAKAR